MNCEFFTLDAGEHVLASAEGAHGIMLDMARYAFELAAKRGGEAAPIWQLVWPDKRRVGLAETPWRDEHEKAIFLDAIRRIIRRDPPAHYSLFSEAWKVTRTGPLAPDSPPPSECDDRTEGLMVLTIARNGERRDTFLPISRDSDGIRQLGEDEGGGWTGFGGAMAELYS